MHWMGMIAVDELPVSCCRVPDLYGAIYTRRGDPFPVGRPRQGCYLVGMPGICAYLAHAIGGPDPYPAIYTPRGDPFPIRRPHYGANSPRMIPVGREFSS